MVKFSFDTERHPPATCMMPLRTTVKLVFTMWLHCRLRYFPALRLFLFIAISCSKLDVRRFSARQVHAGYGVYSCVGLQHFRRNYKLRLTNPPFKQSSFFGFCQQFHEHPPTYIVDSVTTRNDFVYRPRSHGCLSPLVFEHNTIVQHAEIEIVGLTKQTALQFIFL